MDRWWDSEDQMRNEHPSMAGGWGNAQGQGFGGFCGGADSWGDRTHEGFSSEQAAAHGFQNKSWHGEADWMAGARKDMLKPEEYVALQKKMGEVQRRLANLIGSDVRSDEAAALVEESESLVRELYRIETPKDVLLDIAKRYRDDFEMHEMVDCMYGEGVAEFIADAIVGFYA